jgi:hypothetical protein
MCREIDLPDWTELHDYAAKYGALISRERDKLSALVV